MTKKEFFEKMYLENSKKMFHVCLSIVQNREVANELVSETFLTLWTHINTIMQYQNPVSWLYMVLRRQAIDAVRTSKLHAEVPLEEADKQGVEQNFFSFPTLLPARLNDEDRQLLIWRYDQGLEYSEIAELLSISDAACRMRVKRARERCASLLHSKKTE